MEVFIAYALLWIGTGFATAVTLRLWVTGVTKKINYVAAVILTAFGPMTLLLIAIICADDWLNRPKICCPMCGRASRRLTGDLVIPLPVCVSCRKKIQKQVR